MDSQRIINAVAVAIRLVLSTAIVVTPAVFGYWGWAWIVLGLCVLGEVTTIGLRMRVKPVHDEWSDTFNGGAAGTWGLVAVGSENAVWFPHGAPGPTEVSVSCKECGHVVTVRQGDAPIPHGDPRLCEHF